MSRVRIVCKQPPQPTSYPTLQIVPSWMDCLVVVIDDDGKEYPLDCVSKVTFKAECGSEPTTALLEVVGAEIDAEALVPLAKGGLQSAVGCPSCKGYGAGTDCATCKGSGRVFILAAP